MEVLRSVDVHTRRKTVPEFRPTQQAAITFCSNICRGPINDDDDDDDDDRHM